MTIKLYKITRTKCYQMRDQGTGYALEPWSGNTADSEGYDDGGAEYNLFDGFEIRTNIDGDKTIYDSDGSRCFLATSNGQPAIYKPDPDGVTKGKYIILTRAE